MVPVWYRVISLRAAAVGGYGTRQTASRRFFPLGAHEITKLWKTGHLDLPSHDSAHPPLNFFSTPNAHHSSRHVCAVKDIRAASAQQAG